MSPYVSVHLMCSWCGHWERGLRTKEEIAAWLRVHRTASIGLNREGLTGGSTCPHPCGTPPPVPGEQQ